MTATINIPRRVVYMAGAAHQLSRAGANRLFAWLMDNGALLYGWDDQGEYTFRIEVTNG